LAQYGHIDQASVGEQRLGEQLVENVMRLLERMERRAKLICLAAPFENLGRDDVCEFPPH
jgi:hypothetical protein